MDKRVMVLAVIVLILLVACESKTTGRRVAIPERSAKVSAPSGPSGAVVAPVVQQSSGETGKTAAEVLNDLESSPIITTSSGSKSGTFYPPISSDATGKEALKEKTRALFTQNNTYAPNVTADDEFGARYHDKDGDVTNLPDNYSDNEGN